MGIRVLGHLEASVEDRALALGGAKQRAVLAMLALDANRTISAERLIQGVWGERGPAAGAVGRGGAGERAEDAADLCGAAARRAGGRRRGADRDAWARL